jgi:hypothetical protein
MMMICQSDESKTIRNECINMGTVIWFYICIVQIFVELSPITNM